MSILSAGSIAPDFTLHSTPDQTVSLSEFRGSVAECVAASTVRRAFSSTAEVIGGNFWKPYTAASIAAMKAKAAGSSGSPDVGVAGENALMFQTYEGVIEIDYGARITPWLALRPNLQYVINPGARGATANALVAGLYAQVTF